MLGDQREGLLLSSEPLPVVLAHVGVIHDKFLWFEIWQRLIRYLSFGVKLRLVNLFNGRLPILLYSVVRRRL